ncbi:MAG: ARMT1-like domain-containing protein [Micromonosporaceae bacterium]
MRSPTRSRIPRLLPPDQWREIDAAAWREHRGTFLCTDQPEPSRNTAILVDAAYRPDTFTVAERYDRPPWLAPNERDPTAWLTRLVATRLRAAPELAADAAALRAATSHVVDQTRRLLDLPGHDGGTVAEELYNQETPYVIDQLAGATVFDRPHVDLHPRMFHHLGHAVVADLLTEHAEPLELLDTPTLIRVATAAGLIGLDVKGGKTRCRPIPVRGTSSHEATAAIYRDLLRHAKQPAGLDHTDRFLAAVTRGEVRLVWWLDDLIESGFDLLVIQRLATINPRLHVLVVAKNGQHDNDASHRDVARMLRLPALAPVVGFMAEGRVQVTRRGPRMATANPLKLHPELVNEIQGADLMWCKGGRIHEMVTGNVNTVLYTGYVVVREFTESQAGLDATNAPVMIFEAAPGEWPWWGFHGRAHHRLPVRPDRSIRACHSTIAEHHTRATTQDHDSLARDLRRLLHLWPTVRHRYGRAALAEIQLVRDRLIRLQPTPTFDMLALLHRTDQIPAERNHE